MDNNKNELRDSNGQVLCDGTINNIPLDIDSSKLKQGLKHGLPVGTKFKNARPDDKSIYVVKKDEQGKYYIERQVLDGQNRPCTIPIKIEKEDLNTLILYKVN